jgi:hypothetical protein
MRSAAISCGNAPSVRGLGMPEETMRVLVKHLTVKGDSESLRHFHSHQPEQYLPPVPLSRYATIERDTLFKILIKENNMKHLMMICVVLVCLFLSGCLGMTGTHISGSIPNGPTFDYKTDADKEINGLKIVKTADGGWEFILEKSNSTANETMANAMLEMTKKLPNLNLTGVVP